MRHLISLACTLLVLTSLPALAADSSFHFKPTSETSLTLFDNDKPVLVYNHSPIGPTGAPTPRGHVCYFHPIYGLDGEVLTDDFPKDHTYHRGLYCAWPHIKLGDQEYELWTARGDLQQSFVKFIEQTADAKLAKLALENAWTIANKPVVREQYELHIHPATNDSRSIDVRITWIPLEQTLTLSGAEGKSYGGFNFRFRAPTKPSITVPEGTPLPDGVTNVGSGRISGDLLMTRLPWVDYSSTFAGNDALSGATIFVHPHHADFPPSWMARHYGLISVGWPGVTPQTFPAGRPITCQYRLWLHRGHPTASIIQAAYDQAWK